MTRTTAIARSTSPSRAETCGSACGSAPLGCRAHVLLIHGVTASHLSWPVRRRAPRRRAGDRARSARARAQQRTGRTRRARRARARPRRRARCAGRRARRRGRALDGRVRRARARRPVPGAGLAARAGGRRASARPARGPVVRRGHHARARTDRRSARDAVRVASTPTWTSGARIRRSGGTGRPSWRRTSPTTWSARRRSCGPRRATRRSKRTRSTRTPARRSSTRSRGLRHPTVLLTAERGLLDQVPAAVLPRSGCPGCWPRTPTCGTIAVRRREPLHDRDVGARGGCRRRGASARASWPADGCSSLSPAQPASGAPGPDAAIGRELVRVGEQRAAELGEAVGTEAELDAREAQRPLRVSLAREDRGAEAVAALDDQPGVEGVAAGLRLAQPRAQPLLAVRRAPVAAASSGCRSK